MGRKGGFGLVCGGGLGAQSFPMAIDSVNERDLNLLFLHKIQT